MWSSVNTREATPGVLTPYTWSVMRYGFSQMTMLPGYSPVGNICGRIYNNATVGASAYQILGRLEDYEQDAPVLRPARFEDNPIDKAHFNQKGIGWILAKFHTVRAGYLQRLEILVPDDFAKTRLHPRLNKPMRLGDILLFHLEHDRHHLVRIEELKALWEA